jgi:shikimate kinase
MKTNIAIIGFMGAGKTTVARALAKKLNREFIELDTMIELKAGKSITEIFSQDGEIAFRELEIEVTKDISCGRNLVIACGGGIILNQINIDRLRKESVIVYLAVSSQVLLARVKDTDTLRPLLNTEDKKSRIRKLLGFRKPLYEKAADITINTTRLDVGSVVDEMVNILASHESYNIQK